MQACCALRRGAALDRWLHPTRHTLHLMDAVLQLGKKHPKPHPPAMALTTVFSDALATWAIPTCAIIGIVFALWLWCA